MNPTKEQVADNENRRRVIVVAEDSVADLFLIRRAITAHIQDCELLTVDDGEQAIQIIDLADRDESRACPDILVLDWNLPRITGPEILEHLRASRKCSHLPVIVLTSSDSPADQARAEALGADHFRKPNDLDTFMSLGFLVQKLLET